MLHNTSSVITLLLKKAGIDPTDPKYADLVNVSGQIGDDVYTEVERGLNSLITVDQAKYNKDVQAHIRQSTLSPVDQELTKWFDEIGASDEDKADLLADKSTYTKLRKALEKTKEIERKMSGSNSKEEYKELVKKWEKSQADLAELKNQFATKEKELSESYESQIANFALRSKIASLDFANDAMSKEENTAMMLALIEPQLKSKKIKYKFDKDKNDLVLVNAETGEPAHDETSHQPINISDLIQRTATEKKVLKVNDGTDNSGRVTPTAQIPTSKNTKNPALDVIASKINGLSGFKTVV